MADETFEALIQSQLTQEQAPETTEMVNTEIATETEEVIDTANNAEEVNTEMVNTETSTEANTATETIQDAPKEVNFNEWIAKESGGLFDSTDKFKASLDKFKDYDNKVAKVTELEKNQLPDDAFVKTITSMRQNGASKDQITEFIKLNTEYDDFSTMTPEQAKVAKLVLIDGYSKDTAERKVAREFDVSELEEDSDEFRDIKEELRISSREDLKALDSYKAKITTIENTQEAKHLEQVALKSAHEANVKQSIPSLIDKFTGIGEIELKGTLGKEELTSTQNFDYDEDFKGQIPAMLELYFNQEIAPITEERIQEANNYIKATYLTNNWERLLNDAFKSGVALTHEKTENKFVNPKGLGEETTKETTNSAAKSAEWKAFEEKVSNWR